MPRLELPDDFRDLLTELADAQVEFVLVGGWAMAVHGRPRATEDIDILVRASAENSAKVVSALSNFGAPLASHGVSNDTFGTEGPAYRIGVKPLQIQLLTKISGVSFDEVSESSIVAELDGREVRVIGLHALLTNKRAAGRHKDLDDVEWLEVHRGQPQE